MTRSTSASIYLDMKPPNAVEVAAKTYLVGSAASQFQKFDSQRGSIEEHVLCFLDSIGAFPMMLT